MLNRRVLLLFFGLASNLAYAGFSDAVALSSCVGTLKKRIISREFLLDRQGALQRGAPVETLNLLLREGDRSNESYLITKKGEAYRLEEMSYSFHVRKEFSRIESSFELELTNSLVGTGVVVRVVIKTTLLEKERKVLSLKQKFSVGESCLEKFETQELIEFIYDEPDTVNLRKTEYVSDSDQRAPEEKRIPRLYVDSRVDLDRLEFSQAGTYHGLNVFEMIFPFEMQVTPSGVSEEIDDPFLKRARHFPLFEGKVTAGGSPLFNGQGWKSEEGSFRGYRVVYCEKNYLTHTVPKGDWMTVPFPDSLLQNGSRFQMTELTQEDFTDSQFSVEVVASKEIRPYENASRYATLRKVKEDDEGIHYLWSNQSGEAVAAPQEIDPGPYLAETYYYNFSSPEIQELRKKVIEQRGPGMKAGVDSIKAQVDLAQAILGVVQGVFSYDWGMTEKSSVPLMKASEIVSRGSGVCQHYSILYVALARSLGLPARTVMGLSVQPSSVVPHAWVEITVDGKTWAPLEPQLKGVLGLPHWGYLPLASHGIFEVSKIDGPELATIVDRSFEESLMETRMHFRKAKK